MISDCFEFKIFLALPRMSADKERIKTTIRYARRRMQRNGHTAQLSLNRVYIYERPCISKIHGHTGNEHTMQDNPCCQRNRSHYLHPQHGNLSGLSPDMYQCSIFPNQHRQPTHVHDGCSSLTPGGSRKIHDDSRKIHDDNHVRNDAQDECLHMWFPPRKLSHRYVLTPCTHAYRSLRYSCSTIEPAA